MAALAERTDWALAARLDPILDLALADTRIVGGVVLVVMAEVGLIHPPMGMNLYVLQGIGKTVAMRTIALGALPFLGAMFVTIAFLYVFPDIALFLPRHIN